MVVPHRHDEDVAPSQTLTHGFETALLAEVVRISKGNLCLQAEFVCDRIYNVHAWKSNKRVVDDLSILDVEPPDLHKIPIIGAVAGDELSHDGHRLLRVDGEVRPWAEEGLVPKSPTVEVAPVLVTEPIVPLTRGVVSTRGALAPHVAHRVAGVRGV